MKNNESVFDCLGIGLCALDYQCVLGKYPEPDEKTTVKEFTMQGGAPVPTALVALAKWKRSCSFIGSAGNDHEGLFIQRELERYGVRADGMVLHRKARTCKAFVWIDESTGSRACALDQTGALPLPPRAVSGTALPQCRVMHVDGRDARAAILALKTARRRGIPSVIDAGSPRERMDEIFASVDHFVASREFARRYYGAKISPASACEKILSAGPRAAVVTLGEKGCAGATRDGSFMVKAYSKPGFVVDTTGAGDVFHGGYIHGLLNGWDVKRCCEFANAAAFLTCGAIGARDGIPTLNAAMRLYRQ